MTSAFAVPSSSAAEARDPSPSVALHRAAHVASAKENADANGAYTPVASGVRLLHSRLARNGLVAASFARLQQFVPTAAQQAAGQAQQVGLSYVAPLVTRVDDKLNSAIVSVRGLPAASLSYGTATVAAADSFAFSLTPQLLKPTYTATRAKVADVVSTAVGITERSVERVQAVKAERSQQLWDRLAQVQTQLTSLRDALEKTGAQATQALDLRKHVAELNHKLNRALELAQEKRAQARHLSHEIFESVSELTHQLTNFLETSVLTASQRDLLHSLWVRVVERVNGLKAQLHLAASSASSSGSSSPAESASSRSDSTASQESDAATAAVAPASEAAKDSAIAAASAEESDSKTAPAVVESNGVEAASASGLSKRQPHSSKRGSKKGPSKQQQDEEQKQKIAAENE